MHCLTQLLSSCFFGELSLALEILAQFLKLVFYCGQFCFILGRNGSGSCGFGLLNLAVLFVFHFIPHKFRHLFHSSLQPFFLLTFCFILIQFFLLFFAHPFPFRFHVELLSCGAWVGRLTFHHSLIKLINITRLRNFQNWLGSDVERRRQLFSLDSSSVQTSPCIHLHMLQ